jgi:Bacterial Ig domain/Divergent InlB B-repeat domain
MKSRIVLVVCAVCTVTAIFATPALAEWDPPEPVTLSVSKADGGTVSGSGIDCGETCVVSDQPETKQVYAGGIGMGNCGQDDRYNCSAVYHDVTLTATPAGGWAFTGWGGHCSGTNATCSFKLSGDRSVSASFADVGAPDVAVTGPAGNTAGTFTITADASDNNAVSKVAFYVRGVKVGEDTSAPYAASVDSAAIAEGAAELKAVATDAAGLAATATRTVTIDNLKPTLQFNGGPNAATFGLGTTHTWAFAAADAGAGVQSVECKLDAAAYGPCSGGAGSHTVANLPHGDHTLSVRVTDNAGRSDTFTRHIAIDGLAPQTAITGGTADGSSSTDTSASFAFAADQAGSTFKCRVYPAALTPGAFGPCSGAGTHKAPGFAPGTYAFEVIATDPYGNVDGSPAKRAFTVKAPPTEDKPGDGGGNPAGGKIDAKLNTFWRLYGKRTKVRTLTVSNAPAGSKVTISCKGKGCKFRKVSSTLTGSKLKLAVRFKGKKLPARTVITVVVSKEGWMSKTFRYTTRAGKFPKLTLS